MIKAKGLMGPRTKARVRGPSPPSDAKDPTKVKEAEAKAKEAKVKIKEVDPKDKDTPTS